MIEVFLLSIVQGVTEFIPVSSSAHLILFSNLFNFSSENLTIDVSLHFGSFAAIVFYFRKEILDFLKNKNLFFLIILSSLPTLFFGFLFIKLDLINNLRNIKIIGWTTLIFGIILYISDFKSERKKINIDFDLKSALLIGFFQIFSLIPGVSRSGITITAARFINFKRTDAAKISFLLSIPTLGSASIYSILKLVTEKNLILSLNNFTGVMLSFFFSLVTIKYFIEYLKKFSLLFFVIYRIILSFLILLIL